MIADPLFLAVAVLFALAAGRTVAALLPRGGPLSADLDALCRHADIESRVRIQVRGWQQAERSLLGRVGVRAARAGLAFSGALLLAVAFLSGVAVGLATTLYTGNAVAGAVMALVGVQLPFIVLDQLAAARATRYGPQVEAFLETLDSLMTTDLPLVQLVARAAASAAQPLKDDLLGVLAAEARGVPLSDAMRALATRQGNRDLAVLAAGLHLQDHYGGQVRRLVAYLAARVKRRQVLRATRKAESAGERIAVYLTTVMPTIIYLQFVPLVPSLVAYLAGPGRWAVVFLAALQVVVLTLVRWYQAAPDIW